MTKISSKLETQGSYCNLMLRIYNIPIDNTVFISENLDVFLTKIKNKARVSLLNTFFNIVLEFTANIIRLKINLKYINQKERDKKKGRDKAVFVAGMISYIENLA